MKTKKIITKALALLLATSVVAQPLSALAVSVFEPETTVPQTEACNIITYEVVDKSKGLFSLTTSIVNVDFCSMGVSFNFDGAKMKLWNKTGNKVATEFTAANALEAAQPYIEVMEGNVSITGPQGWAQTPTWEALVDGAKVSVILNVGTQSGNAIKAHGLEDRGSEGYVYPASNVPYEYFTVYFQAVDTNNDGDYTAELKSITHEDFTPAHWGTEKWTGGFYNPLPTIGEKECPVYFMGFPAPAVAPTNVTIKAEPASIVQDGSTTLTVGSDASPDGGTLTYGYYEGTEAPNAEQMVAVNNFQTDPTFAVSPTAATTYWGVVKNTKTDDDGEKTYAYAHSAKKVDVAVKKPIPTAAVTVVPPVAEAAVADANATLTTADGANYVVTSTAWDNNVGETFAGTTAYTATITLTANEGFAFGADAAITLAGTDKKAEIVSYGDTLVFTVTYDATGKTSQQFVDEAVAKLTDASFPVEQVVNDPGTDSAADATTVAYIKSEVEKAVTAMDLEGVTVTTGEPAIDSAAVPGKPNGDVNGTDGKYSVTFTVKAVKNEEVTGSVTKTEQKITAMAASTYAQNLNAVKTMKTAVENALKGFTVDQADVNSEAAIQTAVQDKIDAAIGESGIGSAKTGTYTAVVDSTYNKMDGTAGTYVYTVTLTKGTEANEFNGDVTKVPSGNLDTDYKATVTTAELTATITPTGFEPKLGETAVRVSQANKSLTVRPTTTATNVRVVSYTLTVKHPETGVVEGYNGITVDAAGSIGSSGTGTYTATQKVTGLINNVTYTVEVTPVYAQMSNSNTPTGTMVSTTGKPVAGKPLNIDVKANESIYIDKNGTEQSVTEGKIPGAVKVFLMDEDGRELEASEHIYENNVVMLKAEPNPGFHFLRWERKSATDPVIPEDASLAAEDASLATESYVLGEEAAEELTQNPLTVTAASSNEYVAVFAENSVITEGPVLNDLTVAAPVGRALVRDDMSGVHFQKFDSTVTDYTLSVLKDETELKLELAFQEDLVVKAKTNEGEEETIAHADFNKPNVDSGENAHTYANPTYTIKGLTGADDKVTITVTDQKGTPDDTTDDKTTTYTIKVVKVKTNPQILLELDAVEGTNVATVNVKVKASAFNTAAFQIDLAELTGSLPGFAGVCDVNGNRLANGVDYGAQEGTTYKNRFAGIEVTKMAVSADGKTLAMTLESSNGLYVSADGDPAGTGTLMLKFFVLKSQEAINNMTVDADLLKSMTINQSSLEKLYLADQMFGDLYYNEKTTDAAATPAEVKAEDRLIFLKLVEKYEIVFFVGTERNQVTDPQNIDRILFNVYDMLDEADERINDGLLNADKTYRILYRTAEGKYRIEVLAPGYVVYSTDTLELKDQMDLNKVNLVAGDVNGDGKITLADYTALIKALDEAVAEDTTDDTGARVVGGYVEIEGVKYYPDFDFSGTVGAADLAAMLRSLSTVGEAD